MSLVMIVMGALHAAPMDAEHDSAGVIILNCTVMEYCGGWLDGGVMSDINTNIVQAVQESL